MLTMVYTGCTPPTAGTDQAVEGDLSGSIAFFSNIRLSGEQNFTVVYSTSPSATTVSAFYVPVASTAIDAAETGAEVVFASSIPVGANQTTSISTAGIAVGLYRIGLNIVDGGSSIRILSQGTFELTELPTPEFSEPDRDLQILAGAPVDIRVNVGDNENAVQWRLFFVEASSSIDGLAANQIGSEIATGSASQIITIWNTTGLATGAYRIGISVTDSGQSIAGAVSSGTTIPDPTFSAFSVTIVDEIPMRSPPTVVVTQPATNIEMLASDTTLIQFEVTRFEGETQFEKVTPFFDVDDIPTNGNETPIGQPFEPFPLDTTNVVFAGNLIALGQTVFIGVTAEDGVGDPVTTYATGTIKRLDPDAARLTVTQPTNALSQKPGTSIGVAWQVDNLPTTANAEADVFVRRIGADGNPVNATLLDADKINVNPFPLAQTTTTFLATESGKFRVTVRLTFTDGSSDDLVADATVDIQISTLPTVFWLGALAGANPQIKGAIFEGVQFEDNAGSAFEGGEDFDGGGLDETFIVSRYAKPLFQNPSGVGPGEAYMLRGNSIRYAGRHNLNSVANTGVPGFVFTGITPDQGLAPTDTDGMASIFISGDADADGIGEVIFGFPRSFSERQRVLGGPEMVSSNGKLENICPMGTNYPQFTRGGIVIVSSRNTELQSRVNDESNRRCGLDSVGQLFESRFTGVLITPEGVLANVVSPEPGQGTLCQGTSWMEDRLSFVDTEGNCPPEGPPNFIGCSNFLGGDGEQETLVEPTFGFDPRLADHYLCNFPIPCFLGDPHGSLQEDCPGVDVLDSGCNLSQTNAFGLVQFDINLCSQTVDIMEATPPGGDPLAEQTCEAGKDLVRPQLAPLGRAWVEPTVRFMSSGFYRERISGTGDAGDADSTNWNDVSRSNSVFTGGAGRIDSLIGCRFIGETVNEGYGTSITQSDDNLFVTAPFRQTVIRTDPVRTRGGIAYSIEDYQPIGNLPRFWQLPEDLGFDASVYGGLGTPAQPHQYLANGRSHMGVQLGAVAIAHADVTNNLDILGDTEEQISNVLGIPDFNQDGRVDVLIGAPLGDVDDDGTADGAAYVIYRRAETLEGDFDLADLKRNVGDPERLSGVLIREALGSEQRFGESIAGDFDFNRDGAKDIVIGNPDGNGGTGEVVIVFGNVDLISPEDGIPVETEGGNVGLLDRGEGARITGIEVGSEFGFNIRNIGDIDGDGFNDLAIAAPNATPMFDANPNDAVDTLDTPGIDANLDGVRDNVTGPTGIPDFEADGITAIIDANDELNHAGLVYIILSSTNTDNFAAAPGGVEDISITQLGTDNLNGLIIVGHRGDRFAANGDLLHEGDFLGGGDAGEDGPVMVNGVEINYGGNASKAPAQFMGAGGVMLERERGRSSGLGRLGDIDGDGFGDFALGSQLADPRVNSFTGQGTKNGGEAYIIYGFTP
ncbi:MAG: hypothetical protein GXP29_03520 [Planctomycetes bacterium]|nr:hypothetical protein [Planctomycetota bacterium]